jgi:photosystem II stability/assembly factor-like uncharacterized protein
MPSQRFHALLLSASFVFLAFASSRPASAGVDRFTPFGPWNGQIFALAVDPRAPASLLAITQSFGLFRSDDGGRSWSWSGAGLDTDLQQGIAADPANPGSFYLFTRSQVFHSANGGRSWTLVAAGLDFSTPSFPHERLLPGVALLPRGPGTPPVFLVGTFQGLQRSPDGGATWSTVRTSTHVGGFAPVADPSDPQRVWLNTPDLETLTSTDGGQTWNPVLNLPDFLAVTLVLPTQPAAIFAVGTPGVFKSTDQGASWRKLAQDLIPAAYDPENPAIVYSESGTRFSWSTDAGETWTPRGPALPPSGLGQLVAAPGSRTLYAFNGSDFSNSQVFASPDRGRHWSLLAESSARGGEPTRLLFRPGDPTTLYALDGHLAYRSTDRGATWTSLALSTPLDGTLLDLSVDRANPAFLYAASSRGLFRSTDDGTTWGQLAPQVFDALTVSGRTLLGASCALSRSRDGGRTWTTVLPCPAGGGRGFTRFLVDRNPSLVYAQGIDPNDVPILLRSADGGATWRALATAVESPAVDPTRSGRIYGTLATGLARSDDGGLTFHPISSFGGRFSGFQVHALLVDAATPTTLYAAVFLRGVYRSTDGGVTWAEVDAGLARYGSTLVQDLAADPAIPHRIFVFSDTGILESRFSR